MDTAATSATGNTENNMTSTSQTPSHLDLQYSAGAGPMGHTTVQRGIVNWALNIQTVADVLPEPLRTVVNSGKFSVAFFLGGYFVSVGLWFPFWLLSFFVGEWGVYFLLIGAVFMIGRGIIRMIAFPGSSSRVSSEIEKEFSKYSVKMIVNACNSIIDLASAISAAGRGDESKTATSYEITQHWNRAKSYRDRVLGIYADVLSYILNGGQQSSNQSDSRLTKYGNSRLSGDIGDLSGLTEVARADGQVLLQKLSKVLAEMESLESQAKPLLENVSGTQQQATPAIKLSANSMGIMASELRIFVESLKPVTQPNDYDVDSDQDEDEPGMDNVRRHLEEQGSSFMDAVKSGLSSILPMLDPPPHTSIFGFDIQRGCMLSRYRGAKQLWVQREDGGMIDVIHIPAESSSGNNAPPRNGKKAVLYCNPNAGLIEVAAGLALSGGNVDPEGAVDEKSWPDIYTRLGFDVYLFNYAGFGRSYGSGYCGIGKRGGEEEYIEGAVGRMRRILHSTFCGFQPTPATLRADGFAVASYVVSNLGVESLVIHGESIGGVAASSTARKLSQSSFTRDKVALLICDRTFCNLEAVAQRLVGGWSGYAIRALAPLWSTDVTNDFLAAACPKVVANDSADAIIFDSASLKAGIAFWKEIHRSAASTKGIGWKMEAPLQYRMAVDYENVPVNASSHVSSATRVTPPVWPQDKHITLAEAFHFAACSKRIGKLASLQKKRFVTNDTESAMRGNECLDPIFQAWKILGTCEGLCGAALGIAVKGGYDVTVSWLCCTLTFGGQTVIEGMEHRHNLSEEQARYSFSKLDAVTPKDFDCRPDGFENQESETTVHPKPIPNVIEELEALQQEFSNDEVLRAVSHELGFILDTLKYVVARLESRVVVEASFKNRHLLSRDHDTVGSFLNLHCGHNNPFSNGEKQRLRSLLLQATASSSQ